VETIFFGTHVVVREMDFVHLKVCGILVNVTFKWVYVWEPLKGGMPTTHLLKCALIVLL